VGPFIGGIFWHSFGATSVFYVMSGISTFPLLLVFPFLPFLPLHASGFNINVFIGIGVAISIISQWKKKDAFCFENR
jgi:hypothetical protein